MERKISDVAQDEILCLYLLNFTILGANCFAFASDMILLKIP